MPFVKVGTENSADIEIHYNDHGAGKPIVPDARLPARRQLLGAPGSGLLLANGYPLHHLWTGRGFGKSSPARRTGYDYDTFAVRSQVAAGPPRTRSGRRCWPGFSMGTGEVRCATSGPTDPAGGQQGGAGFGSIPPVPACRQTTTPRGVPRGRCSTASRRRSWPTATRTSTAFFAKLLQHRCSSPRRRIGERPRLRSKPSRWRPAPSPYATLTACIDTWLTDFRTDLSKIPRPGARPCNGTADRGPAVRGHKLGDWGATRD